MDYHFAPRTSHKNRRRLLIVTLVVVALWAADLFGGGILRAQVRAVGARISIAGERVVHFFSESGYFSSRRALESKISSLQDEVRRLTEKEGMYDALRRENDEFRALLTFAEPDEGITAPVVSSFRASPYGTFMIGAGSADGVAIGNLVVTRGGFVIGRVSELGERTSLVTQLFAPGESIDALVGGTAVPLEGRGGGNAYARMPHGVQVQPGDAVVAPAYGARPVGVVARVEDDQSSAFSEVFIGLPVNIAALQFVYVQK